MKLGLGALLVTVLLGALVLCQSPRRSRGLSKLGAFKLDTTVAESDLGEFVREPHPMGSPWQSQLADFIHGRLTGAGIAASIQRFDAKVPIREKDPAYGRDGSYKRVIQGFNVLGYLKSTKQTTCIQILGSHYDTKIIPGLRYVGANDSGSSSALLLQLASYFKSHAGTLDCDLLFVWFDGEESVLDDWNRAEREPYNQQDNTYGSRYFVSQMKPCALTDGDLKASVTPNKKSLCWREQMQKPIKELLLLDMVGSENIKISLDRLSTKSLVERLQAAAKSLGLEEHVDSSYTFVEDDHMPFLKVGIDAIDMIDFNNLDYWHKPGDEVANLSMRSMEIAGQLVSEMIRQK